MIFALTFDKTFDLTAVGTLALALVTLALAGVTLWLVLASRGALTVAQTGLAQTQRETELSRQEVEEAHRSVVVRSVDETRSVTTALRQVASAKPLLLRGVGKPRRPDEEHRLRTGTRHRCDRHRAEHGRPIFGSLG